MPSPRYRLSASAKSNMAAIYRYTQHQWGDAQAKRYTQALFTAFGKLSVNPSLGHSRSDVPTPYLAYAVGEHLVIYRVRDRLEILNILHHAMDVEPRIEEAIRRYRAQ